MNFDFIGTTSNLFSSIEPSALIVGAFVGVVSLLFGWHVRSVHARSFEEDQRARAKMAQERLKENVKNNHSRRPIVLFGTKYASIAQAVEETGMTRQRISELLADPDQVDCYYATISWHDVHPPGPQPQAVIIDDKQYASVSEACAQMKIAKSTMRDRLKSKNFPTYQYADGRTKRQ